MEGIVLGCVEAGSSGERIAPGHKNSEPLEHIRGHFPPNCQLGVEGRAEGFLEVEAGVDLGYLFVEGEVLGSALHHGHLLVAGDGHPGGVAFLLQLYVEYLGDVGVVHADEGDCEHHVALGAHLQSRLGGVGLVEGGGR